MTLQIELNPEEERALREQARLRGRDPAQYARDILRDHIIFYGDRSEVTVEELIDYEFEADCKQQAEGDVPTIEDVRKMLATIPGSMARAIIEEERAGRL